MSTAAERKAAEWARLKLIVFAVLSDQPGSTAYMISAASEVSVSLALTLLRDLEKDGLAYSMPYPSGACWYLTGNETGNDPKKENRTGDEIMTTRKTPEQKMRARQVAAAKRSLALIIETANHHMELLEAGEVPESSFLASANKYDQALGTLAVLSELAGNVPGSPEADGLVEVQAADLQALVSAARMAFPNAGAPLARLESAIPPWSTQPTAPPAPEPVPPQPPAAPAEPAQ